MKRWTRMAILCALIAAVCHTSPVNAAISNGSYIAETSAINVVNHFPGNMSVGISPETPLTVEFGGALNQSFYQNVSFNLFNGTEPVNGELFYNPAAHQIMFKASQPLAQGQTYTAQVSYYDGLGRTSEKVWSFQTANLGEAAVDNTTQKVSQATNSSTSEQQNSKNLILTNASMGVGTIRSDGALEISFSEALDVKSLKSAPVQLYENNRPVGIDYRLSKDMKTITVSPRNTLKTNAAYAIAIDKTIASASGKKLAKKTLIPFKVSDTTEAAVSQAELEERATAAVASTRKSVANTVDSALQRGQNTYNAAQNTYANALQSGQQAYNSGMESYQNALQNGQQIYQQGQQTYQNTVQSGQQAYQNAANSYQNIQQNAMNNYQNVQQSIQNSYAGMQNSLQSGIQAGLQGNLQAAQQTLQSGYQAGLQGIQQSAQNSYQNVQQNAMNNYQNVQQNVQNSYQNMKASASSLATDIENPFASSNTSAAVNPSASSYASNQLSVARASMTQQPQQQKPVAEQVQLIGLAPQNGAKVSNLAQPITIGFSDEIKAETLNEFTFRLEDDFGPVPAKIHYFKGNKQATLTPVGLLDAERNYRVVVTQGVTDLYGRPIKSGINSMFATTTPTSAPQMPVMQNQTMTAQANPQREAQELESFDNPNAAAATRAAMANPQSNNMMYQQPVQKTMTAQSNYTQMGNTNSYMAGADKTVRASAQADAAAANNFKVASIYPGLNSDNIARKAKIAVHFSEPCDPKTVNNINISVFANQTRVDGKVTYDRRNNRAIFEPTRPLEAKTEHKVIVSDKILNKMGQPLSKRFSWTFNTTSDTRNQYVPTANRNTAEADSAFYIPLVDSKVKMTPGQQAALAAQSAASNTSTSSFTYVNSKHWSFKSMKHITNKGILNAYPFTFTDNVTRYEFASAINNALNNLKSMQNSNSSKLRVADMIELEQLVVEYRSELKSYGVNTAWFENFLLSQGVNLNQVEAKVRQLNG